MPVPVISIAQMREWEKSTWASGKTEAEVIRRVGENVARCALRLTRPGDLILILAGKGHNGDDARAAQPHLAEREVAILNVTRPKAALAEFAEKIKAPANGRPPQLIIDGLFGIGLTRPLDGDWKKFIESVNESRIPVLAVDVPSGLSAETGEPMGTAIRATLTLTVGAPKMGLLQQNAWQYVGRLEVANDVGLELCPHTSELNWTLPEDFSGFPPARPVTSHKGSFGHLAILAGSLGFHGAAVMAARGAQRARPGLITLFTHEPVFRPVASQLQAVMVHPWSADIGFDAFSALLIGPGLAAPDVPDEMKKTARGLWRDSPVPVIVDASTLDWLPHGATPTKAVRVITPHPGEAARLLKTSPQQVQSNRSHALRAVSRNFGGSFVVLKGHQTLIGRSEGPLHVNPSGNPNLAQGGAGDVLSGHLAGLLAQPDLQPDALKTIRYGVWQHGAAADLLETTRPNWVVEDLIEALGMHI